MCTMTTELGPFSSTQIQKLAHQSQQNQPIRGAAAWMLNPKQAPQENDDSWEIRAFAEETGNIMGTTWPPGSYTCTFCIREFRSAQALGGHTNVHRQDRARLHQKQPPATGSSSSTSSATFIIRTQEFSKMEDVVYSTNYQTQEVSSLQQLLLHVLLIPPSTHLSISPNPPNNLIMSSANFPVAPTTNFPTATTSNKNQSAFEELDLELQLGHRPTPT